MVRRSGQKAFTLIELLIVVAIIGILAAIAIPNFLNAQTRAKVASAKAGLSVVATGLESYRVDNSDYPPYMDGGGTMYGFLKRLEQVTEPVSYLKSVPEDPFAKAQVETFPGYDYPYVGSGPKPRPWTFDYLNCTQLRQRGGDWRLGVRSGEYTDLSTMFPREIIGISQANIKWAMLSIGPDGKWDDSFQVGTPIKVYDPTNGITSDGDIHMLGPGLGLINK